MKRVVCRCPAPALTKSALGLLAAMAVTGVPAPAASAKEGDAQTILKAMADYLSRQENLSLKYDADVEAVTPAVEKIQFSASGDVTLSRPNRFRISRTGGYADIEVISDGSNVTVFDRGGNRFAQVPATGSFDEVVGRLRSEATLEVPGADLLLSKPYEELMAGVLEAKHIGRGVVEGVECEHLAFRNLDTDWQIWVEVGDRPLPRKYVITSKSVGAAPQYSLRMRDWKTGVSPAPDAFAFKPPEGSSGVAITLLKDIDEVPAGVVPEVHNEHVIALKLMSRAALALLAGGAALFWSGDRSLPSSSFINQAEARSRAAGNAHELCRRGPADHPQEYRLWGAAGAACGQGRTIMPPRAASRL